MNADELLRHFERVADAPGAVVRLRRFVLDLAIRGKLTNQCPTDEPASELLGRIASEKARLSAAGLIRPQKPAPTLEDEPFRLPESWCWTQLVEIGLISPRNDAPDETPASFVPMTLVAAEYGVKHGHEIRPWGEIKKGYTHFANEDVGLAKITPCFENGKSTVFRGLSSGIGSGTTELHVVRPVLVSPDFIVLVLKSPHFIETGIPMMTGTAGQKRVPAEYFGHSPFPLPPLAEQHRIVAKVDELMALCDRLEAARAEREAARDRLTAATLTRINFPDPESSPAVVELFLRNLPAYTSRSSQMDGLRMTILGLAMSGKLLPQHEHEGRATTMLARGVPLPEDYQRRRKILKESSVTPQENLFPDIPANWTYTDIQTLYDANIVVDYADGNHGALYPRSSEFGDTGVTFVTAKDLANGRVNWATCSKLNDTRARQLLKGWSRGGDVLLTHNATVGRVAQVEADAEPFLLGTSVTFYRLNTDYLDPGFFFFMLQSPLWQGQLEAVMAQTTRNQVSIQKQASFRVALPPIAEQRRIAARLEDLLSLCDRIERSLNEVSSYSRRLLDALLHHALHPTEGLEVAT